MLCFVCLESSAGASVLGNNVTQNTILDIIERHLQLKPFVESASPELCYACWTKLKDFHEFYEHVIHVHRNHQHDIKDLSANSNKEAIQCQENFTDLRLIKAEECDDARAKSIEILYLATEHDPTENPLAEHIIDDIKTEEHPNNAEANIICHTINKPIQKPGKFENTKSKHNASEQMEVIINSPPTEKYTHTIEGSHELFSSGEENIDLKRGKSNREGANASKSKSIKCRRGHRLLEENEELIRRHIKMLCDLCPHESADFLSIVMHYKMQHSSVKPYIKCCERKLDCPSDILQHAHYHEDPEHFKCNECGKRFINKSGLKDHHLQYHEPEENLTFGCDQCPRRFARKNLLEHHKSKHIPKTERSYFCEICKPRRAFANEYILQIHIKSRHTKATNICHVCAKEIRDKQAFEKHVRLHYEASGPRLKCPRDGCDSWLKDDENLKQHLRRFHDAQQYECPQCGRMCKNKHSLTCHLKNTHTTKTFTCEECHKIFKSQQSLKEHVAGHTGEALYGCPFCIRTFNSKANMYSHKKKAHPLEWKKSKMM